MIVSHLELSTQVRRLMSVLFVATCLLNYGCGPSGPQPQNQKKVVPVSGMVTVDGEAVANVRIRLNPKDGYDATNPTMSSAITDEEGMFAVTTYFAGDGAPVGEYILTFKHIADPSLKSSDGLRGRYSNVRKSKFTVTVGEEDTSVDAGMFDLVTQ